MEAYAVATAPATEEEAYEQGAMLGQEIQFCSG